MIRSSIRGEQRSACPASPRAAGESGQRPTISGTVDRAAGCLRRVDQVGRVPRQMLVEVVDGLADSGRDRTQSSSRTSTTLTPWRFCASGCPGRATAGKPGRKARTRPMQGGLARSSRRSSVSWTGSAVKVAATTMRCAGRAAKPARGRSRAVRFQAAFESSSRIMS